MILSYSTGHLEEFVSHTVVVSFIFDLMHSHVAIGRRAFSLVGDQTVVTL